MFVDALLDFLKIDNVCNYNMKKIRHSDYRNQTFTIAAWKSTVY